MMPIDFWASLEPWEKAIAQADTSWSRREARVTSSGRTRLQAQVRATITKNAMKNPIVGDTTRGTSTFWTRACHLKALSPAWATTAPARPPMRACEELDGI